MQQRLWRILGCVGIMLTLMTAQAQDDPCAGAAVLSTFQVAVESDTVGVWAQGYRDCSPNVQRSTALLAAGYRGLIFETRTFEAAANFDGQDDYGLVSFTDVLNQTKFTLEAWVYPEEIRGNWQPLVAKEGEDAYSRNYGLFITPDALTVHASLMGDDCYTNFYLESHTPLLLNAWNHVAMSYDGSMIRIYINGIFDSELSYGGGVCQSEQPLYVGNHPGRFVPFKGQLAEIRLWDRPLSMNEINEGLYTLRGGDEPGLVGYWRLDDEDDIIRDSSSESHGSMYR